MRTRDKRPLPSSNGWIFRNSTIKLPMMRIGWNCLLKERFLRPFYKLLHLLWDEIRRGRVEEIRMSPPDRTHHGHLILDPLIIAAMECILFGILEEFTMEKFDALSENGMDCQFSNTLQELIISLHFLLVAIGKFLDGNPAHHPLNVFVGQFCPFNAR